ncbi:MAG: ECF transporter S component, partial [Clostridia bacterium]
MPQLNRKALVSTQNLTVISILAAISAVLYMVEIPVVLFYKLDFSNLPVLLGTFAMGPFAGMLVLLVKDLLGLLHSSSQGVGEIADFLTALAMIIPAGLIYQKDKSRNSAVLGMVVGAVAASLVGVFSNVYLLVPFYGVV